jgi:hypothetical protein
MNKQYTISINIHNDKYIREISLTPITNSIILSYRTLEFKISIYDESSYNKCVDFLVNEIKDDIYNEILHNVSDDEEYDNNVLIVKKNDTVVFTRSFTDKQSSNVISLYLKNMLFVN